MEVLRDGVLAFLAAVGLVSLFWLAAGRVLHTGRPYIGGLLLVLPLREEAPALEENLRALHRLREKLPGARIILADCGLDEDTRKLARYLADREGSAVLADGREPIIT